MKKAIFCISILAVLVACEKSEIEIDSMVISPSLDEVITGSDFSRASNGAYNNNYIDNYSAQFTRNGESTVDFSGQTTRLKQTYAIGKDLITTKSVAEIQLMFEGEEVNGNLQSAGFEDASLNGTTKIVRSKTSASIGLFNKSNSIGQGATNVNLIDSFIEGHQIVIDNWSTQVAAGQAGTFLDSDGATRYVDEKGFEMDQLFTKSMVGALAYDQAVNHYFNRLDDENDNSNTYRTANDEGTVASDKNYTTMEHHWDEAFGYVYGNITSENLIYKYIDNVDALTKFAGIEKEILEAFVKGRIAIVEKNYTERDAQIAILREKLSTIVAVRAVHYLGGGAKLIGTLAPDAAQRADAFHDICEGYGFINSLRYIVDANGNRYFTDAEVDGYLNILEADKGLWSITSDELIDMADTIAAKSVGGFSWTYSDVVPE
ncbi:DUF4856 domain-containing protein [Polaribacter sp. M15]